MQHRQAYCWSNLTVVNQSQSGTKNIQDTCFVCHYARIPMAYHTMKIEENNGDDLSFLVTYPDGYSESTRYPLIVMLHGYGAHMGDLASLAPEIHPSGYIYAFPNAPLRVEFGGGAWGYSWLPSRESLPIADIQQAEETVLSFVTEVAQRFDVPHGQILLAGFSQGGRMIYTIGLSNPETFAGLAVLSSGISDPESLRARLPEHRDQRIFIAHGTEDNIERGRKSREFLVEEGYSPSYHEYNMGHEITPNVIHDLAEWIVGVLAPAVPNE